LAITEFVSDELFGIKLSVANQPEVKRQARNRERREPETLFKARRRAHAPRDCTPEGLFLHLASMPDERLVAFPIR
jgi:hypothetical protein